MINDGGMRIAEFPSSAPTSAIPRPMCFSRSPQTSISIWVLQDPGRLPEQRSWCRLADAQSLPSWAAARSSDVVPARRCDATSAFGASPTAAE
jgi:hypothetical protein